MLFSKKGYLSGYLCSEKPVLRRLIKAPYTVEFVSGKRSYLCVLLVGVITQKPSSSVIFNSMEGGHMFIPADLC